MQTYFNIPTFGDDRLPPHFWAKVRVLDNGCWEWTAVCGGGYGHFSIKRKPIGAHRWAYEQLVGQVPKSLQIDHLCHNSETCLGGVTCPHRRCVNPNHLDIVTPRENTLRGNTLPALNAQKSHCPRNHLYDERNTRLYRGKRHCRACARMRWHRLKNVKRC